MVSSAAVSQVWAACGAMPWSSLPTKPQRSQRSQRVLEGLMDPDGWRTAGRGWRSFAKDVLVVPRHWFHAAMASAGLSWPTHSFM